MCKPKILIVEDESIEVMGIEHSLKSSGYEVVGNASTGDEALQKVAKLKPDLVLMDIVLNGEIDGIEAAAQIKENFDIPVIYLTAHPEESAVQRAKLTAPYGYIIKPFNKTELKNIIELALTKHEMETQLNKTNKDLIRAQRIAKIGSWENNLATNDLHWSEEMYKILGFPTNTSVNLAEVTSIFPPEELIRFQHAVNAAINEDVPYSMDYKIIRPDGSVRYIHDEGEIVRNKKGEAKSMFGTTQDITKPNQAEKALIESEEKFRMLFDNALDMISLIEIKENGLLGKYIEVNKIGIERLGYTRQEFLNMTPQDIVVPEKHAEMSQIAGKLIKNGHVKFEIVHISKDGRKIPVEINNHLFELNGKNVALAVIRDITEIKVAEKALMERNNSLNESEAKFRNLVETSPDIIWEIDSQGEFIYISPNCLKITGYQPEEIIGKSIYFLIKPEYIPKIEKIFLSHLKEKKHSFVFEIPLKHHDGTRIFIEIHSVQIKDNEGQFIGFRGIARDITERKNSEDEIKNSLAEKEILLKEIHHRVKNNLQIVSSLLNLQEIYVKEDHKAVNVLKESQNRVLSMAMIHEKLYESKDLTHINFYDYIQNLVYDLFHSYSVKDNNIIPLINVDNILLNIETAVPCGLIINELLSNILKYAFPYKTGKICIDLHQYDEELELIISDDGVGFPENLDFRNIQSSLGLRLVNSLVKQLDGSIKLDRSQGTKFSIKFKELKYKERI
jgi:PAS domain S-box-containing protein